jgi:hypothetical protein
MGHFFCRKVNHTEASLQIFRFIFRICKNNEALISFLVFLMIKLLSMWFITFSYIYLIYHSCDALYLIFLTDTNRWARYSGSDTGKPTEVSWCCTTGHSNSFTSFIYLIKFHIRALPCCITLKKFWYFIFVNYTLPKCPKLC